MKATHCLLITLLLFSYSSHSQSSFVKVKDYQFILNNKPYYYIGTNYWFGSLLAKKSDPLAKRKKLLEHLDFLHAKGINNLRILAGSEGLGKINGVYRAEPSYQTELGKFNDTILQRLDFLLYEMGKRNMKGVIFLSNNWEWSGGFLQYVNWNGLLPDSILRRKLTWDENNDYVMKFYDCNPCKDAYYAQVKSIVNRTNSITRIRYKDDKAIMAWELANEPRPMREAGVSCFTSWMEESAALIKSLDSNHLVTTGSEGETGCGSMKTFEAIHKFKNIDYLTIHILPKNWGWFKDTLIYKSYDNILSKTLTYVSDHIQVANKLNKPVVIEEFAIPRDKHSFDYRTTTRLRNNYFQEVFTIVHASHNSDGIVAGCNFWSVGGKGRAAVKKKYFWNEGDPYTGDPPQEEQGLNSVFFQDQSTWTLVTAFNESINKNKPLAKNMHKNFSIANSLAGIMNKNSLLAKSKKPNSLLTSMVKK